ncbi:MAG: hypothetical protein KGR42_09100, partial [Acidobacteria bacterium]|nr:hypothetical protein [Acidobacteriota bacterium]
TATYTQDASGNLTTLPTGASGTYDHASEITSSTLGGTSTTYSYDAAGNRVGSLVSGTTSTAQYNGANQLTYYNDTVAGTQQYLSMQYNGLGLRSASTLVNSSGTTYQTYVWNSLPSEPQLLRDSTYAYLYDGSYSPFAEVNLSSGAVTYLLHDALGSVRGVVNSSGALVGSTSYSAWGQPTSSLSSSTPFGFAGSYVDATGLEYLINRYYEGATGQFFNVDPLVRTSRAPYVYAGDNPSNSIDPTGKLSEGYCVWGNFSFIGAAGWGSGCLVETNGNSQVGVTFTFPGGGPGISAKALNTFANLSPNLLRDTFSWSIGVAYEVSNANQLSDLNNWFLSSGGSICIDNWCGMYSYFSGGAIHGQLFGVGMGSGRDVSLSRGYDYTFTWRVTGVAASVIAGIITGLNYVNPLHWLAGPLDLYTA